METKNVILHPLSTEKAIRLMESENKLIFAVDKKATKPEIKDAIQKMFKVKITKVTTLITPKGQKRAYVTLSPETPALDISTELGLM